MLDTVNALHRLKMVLLRFGPSMDELSTAALKNDFVDLFCDGIIKQTGYRLNKVFWRLLHKMIDLSAGRRPCGAPYVGI